MPKFQYFKINNGYIVYFLNPTTNKIYRSYYINEKKTLQHIISEEHFEEIESFIGREYSSNFLIETIKFISKKKYLQLTYPNPTSSNLLIFCDLDDTLLFQEKNAPFPVWNLELIYLLEYLQKNGAKIAIITHSLRTEIHDRYPATIKPQFIYINTNLYTTPPSSLEITEHKNLIKQIGKGYSAHLYIRALEQLNLKKEELEERILVAIGDSPKHDLAMYYFMTRALKYEPIEAYAILCLTANQCEQTKQTPFCAQAYGKVTTTFTPDKTLIRIIDGETIDLNPNTCTCKNPEHIPNIDKTTDKTSNAAIKDSHTRNETVQRKKSLCEQYCIVA